MGLYFGCAVFKITVFSTRHVMDFATEISSMHLQHVSIFMPEQMTGTFPTTFSNPFLLMEIHLFCQNICFYGSNDKFSL